MRISLKVKKVGDKKCFLIPSYYYDIFKPGERYGVFTCTEIARYRVLLIPAYLYDSYEEGKKYTITIQV